LVSQVLDVREQSGISQRAMPIDNGRTVGLVRGVLAQTIE
jgi:hypothetical protein